MSIILKRAGKRSGILAQLGEHLPYKQRVTGSSPVGPIFHVLMPAHERRNRQCGALKDAHGFAGRS